MESYLCGPRLILHGESERAEPFLFKLWVCELQFRSIRRLKVTAPTQVGLVKMWSARGGCHRSRAQAHASGGLSRTGFLWNASERSLRTGKNSKPTGLVWERPREFGKPSAHQ